MRGAAGALSRPIHLIPYKQVPPQITTDLNCVSNVFQMCSTVSVVAVESTPACDDGLLSGTFDI